MEKTTISECVQRREYGRLYQFAQEYLKTNDWSSLIRLIQNRRDQGKSRDALVTLLQLEAVGGTDSDILKEFSDLEGATPDAIRAHTIERAIELLTEQIENRHTYFLDIEAMAETPYAILVKDVIEARKKELAELESNPSRIEILGTFYGFMILMIDGSQPHDNSTQQQNRYRYGYWRRRTWLDEKISVSAAAAIKKLTGDFAEEVDMDTTYRTLGSSQIFKSRCTPQTAEILANAVRLSLYKVPGNRSSAALALGKTGDSRALPFLHHRLGVEQSRQVEIRIAEALGKIGHIDSLYLLSERLNLSRRSLSKDQDAIITAIGRIYAPKSKEILLDIMNKSGNTVKGAAIRAIGTQHPEGLVKLITPYVKDSSRPVVRAAVLALTDLGQEGEETIRKYLSTILNRIGSDKPSRSAIIKILEIPDISQKRAVQEFFAKRIYKLRKDVENWKRRVNTSSYSWWYRRREQRVKNTLRDAVNMVNHYLQPPFQVELLNSVEAALKTMGDQNDIFRTLGQSKLSKAIMEQNQNSIKSAIFEQTYFV